MKEAEEIRMKVTEARDLDKKQRRKAAIKEAQESNAQGKYGTVIEPRKSLTSFLRNQNKFEVSVISIIDRKSAILIRISTAVISGLIVFHEYMDLNVVLGHELSYVLIIGSMISLVLAILATKPVNRFITNKHTRDVNAVNPNLEANTFFMWNSCSLEEYEKAMQKVVRSQDLQLGNQIRANFLLARNNAYKARMVKYAYNAFLCTFIISGLLFLGAKYFT